MNEMEKENQNVCKAYEKASRKENSKSFNEELKMERNLFAEYKERERLAINCCKVTEAGKVLWNEGIIIELVEKLGIHSVKLGKEFKYIKCLDDTMIETNYEEIKESILYLMNNPYSQRERLHLIRKNVFFSEKLLKNLKEAIPAWATEDCFEFSIKEGLWIVTKDKMYIEYIYCDEEIE